MNHCFDGKPVSSLDDSGILTGKNPSSLYRSEIYRNPKISDLENFEKKDFRYMDFECESPQVKNT
jgi:hypothetical protein